MCISLICEGLKGEGGRGERVKGEGEGEEVKCVSLAQAIMQCNLDMCVNLILWA